jgi:hypothetical protein
MPGRNDTCPCGSGRKFKHCCLNAHSNDDAARLRIRRAEGRIVDLLLPYLLDQWSRDFFLEAWDEFFLWTDVPEDITGTKEFETMFLPWLTTLFVAEPEDAARVPWPVEPVAMHWLKARRQQASDAEAAWIHAACRSPMSVFVVEDVTRGRSVDLKDILTGRRFHVLEVGASQTLDRNDVAFTRVVTLRENNVETSVMFGMAPWRMGPEWHAPIIDFREQIRSGGLMTRADLEDFDIEIRQLYLDIAAKVVNPAPPQLCNTDGDPLVLTTLTFTVQGTVDEVAEHLLPLALLPDHDPDEEALDEFERDGTGAMTSATLSWKKAGNKKQKEWSNTILGTVRLTGGRIVAEVNSEERARRCARELKKLLGSSVTLISSEATDLPTTLKKRPAAPPEVRDPELVAMEEELFKQHMDAWVDTKVPALGNKTPRVLARTALGRERLAALLSTFERGQVDRLPNGRALLNDLRVKLGLDPS